MALKTQTSGQRLAEVLFSPVEVHTVLDSPPPLGQRSLPEGYFPRIVTGGWAPPPNQPNALATYLNWFLAMCQRGEGRTHLHPAVLTFPDGAAGRDWQGRIPDRAQRGMCSNLRKKGLGQDSIPSLSGDTQITERPEMDLLILRQAVPGGGTSSGTARATAHSSRVSREGGGGGGAPPRARPRRSRSSSPTQTDLLMAAPGLRLLPPTDSC